MYNGIWHNTLEGGDFYVAWYRGILPYQKTNNAGYELSINLYYIVIKQKQKAVKTYRITDQ